jgi:hypothetical protein
VILLLTLLFGAALGWFLRRRPLRAPRRAIAWLVAIAIGGPLLLFWAANILNSDALGWMAGLSMMVLLASAPVLGFGGLLGWWLAGRSSGSGGSGSEGGAQARIPSREVSPSVRAPSWWNPQLGLIVVMAGVGAAFWVFITIGFWWHHQTPPDPVSSGFPTAVVVFVTASAFGVWQIRMRRGHLAASFSYRPRRLKPSAEMAQRQVWLSSLANDPLRRHYWQMIHAGESYWTPARVEYDLDPHATTCCRHLAPIESAMRAVGIRVRLSGVRTADAWCRVEMSALGKRFELSEKVLYLEPKAYDRSVEDPPQAYLQCSICDSRLRVAHPTVSPGAPLFP